MVPMKKILTFLLVFVFVLAFAAGCADSPPPAPAPAPTSPDTPAPPVQPQTPAPPSTPNTEDPGTGTEGEQEPAGPVPPIMISAAVLAEIINEDNLILIGVVSPTAALVPFSNAANPIRDSYLVWTGDYFGTNPEALSTEVTTYRPPLSDMERLLSRAGVTADSKIVVYSSDWLSQGGYVAWQLSMMGLDVSFLDGGVSAWRAIRGATGRSSRLADQNEKNEFRAPDYNPAAFDATIDVVIEALQNPDEWVVIDTRDADEYSGARTGSSGGAFGTGRMKGAVHVDWERAFGDDDLLLSRERLMDLYDFIGDRKVIVYCQGGVRSAYTWMVLRDLGYEVLNYDGSWIEWSYAASTASSYSSDVVLALTEEWTDNGGRI